MRICFSGDFSFRKIPPFSVFLGQQKRRLGIDFIPDYLKSQHQINQQTNSLLSAFRPHNLRQDHHNPSAAFRHRRRCQRQGAGEARPRAWRPVPDLRGQAAGRQPRHRGLRHWPGLHAGAFVPAAGRLLLVPRPRSQSRSSRSPQPKLPRSRQLVEHSESAAEPASDGQRRWRQQPKQHQAAVQVRFSMLPQMPETSCKVRPLLPSSAQESAAVVLVFWHHSSHRTVCNMLCSPAGLRLPGAVVETANLCASTAQRATANVRFIVRRTTTHPIQRPTSATKRGQCTMAPTRLQRFGSSKLARMACGRQVTGCWVRACTAAESCRRLKPTHHAMDRDLVSSLSFA